VNPRNIPQRKRTLPAQAGYCAISSNEFQPVNEGNAQELPV
jgi:hypothetical protein